MGIENLRDLKTYLSRTKFPGNKLTTRIIDQFGNIGLPEDAIEIACGGGLGAKEERQRFYGLVVFGQGRDTHFSGKERSLLGECAKRFDHHTR